MKFDADRGQRVLRARRDRRPTTSVGDGLLAQSHPLNGDGLGVDRRALGALGDLVLLLGDGRTVVGAKLVSSHDNTGAIARERNRVVATPHTIVAQEQLLNDLVAQPLYRRLTAVPPRRMLVARY